MLSFIRVSTFLLTSICLLQIAHADQPISIEAPWMRATIGNNKNTAAYMVLHNRTKDDIRLIAARWDDESSVTSMVQLHQSVNIDGNWQMQHQQEGIVIPAQGSVTLKPRDYHVMLMGLSGRITFGRQYILKLIFDTIPPMQVTFDVQKNIVKNQ